MELVNPGWRCRRTTETQGVRTFCALLGVAALTGALPAAAQQEAYAVVQSEILDSSTVQNAADLDFGAIMPSGTAGTVVLTPGATATCTTTGGIVRSGTCKAASFTGLAFASADLRVQRPNGNSITLTGPGGATMQVNAFTFGSAGTTLYAGANGANHHFQVNALDGTYLFFVGGRLNVAANQAPGIYNGTFQIRITYN